MKTPSIIAISLFSIASAAFAVQGEATYDYPQAVSANKSRADVQTEARQARAAGQIVSGETYVFPASNVTNKTRAEARTLADASAEQRLPLNVEGISFDGRTPAQGARADSLVASARR